MSLPKKVVKYLEKKQIVVNANPQDFAKIWKAARQTKTVASVADTLAAMFGPTGRCFFCNDSLACDIDHFAPKAVYVARMFKWTNMMYICATCNRKKSNRFPLDGAGRALLIDPTKVQPWKFLYFDSVTGLLSPAYLSNGIQDPRGKATLEDVLEPLNYERIAHGRRIYSMRLSRRVSEYLATPNSYQQQLIEDEGISENCYGLASWYFRFGGRQETPYSALRLANPVLFAQFAARVA